MIGSILNSISTGVKFNEIEHEYYFEDKKLLGVSRMLEQFEKPFDKEMISFMVARKQIREETGWKEGMPEIPEDQIQDRRILVLAEWDALRDDSIDHGDYLHMLMQKACNDNLLPGNDEGHVAAFIDNCNNIYKEFGSEIILSIPGMGIAGKTDFAGIRKTKELIIDVKDFKTNKRKGIQFDSITWKTGKPKHENKFFIGIIKHLEYCSYVKYSLQISTYALMLEKILNAKIGKLSIEFISTDEDQNITGWNVIPIPYMRTDVLAMIQDKCTPILNSSSATNVNW